MMGFAQALGLSYADMVDITAWALLLVTLGVFTGKCLYDIFDSFAGFCALLIRLSIAFMAKCFPNVRKNTKRTPSEGAGGD